MLTFVFVSAHLVKVFDLLARGLPPDIVLLFLLYSLPEVLKFTLPLALLCAAVLCFSRLSAENEITAMRASGISLWQIVSPGLLLAVALSAACVYLHTALAPAWKYRADQLRRREGAKNSMAFLDAGIVEFRGYVLYVGGREGDLLEDVSIYCLGADGRVVQDVRARQGTVAIDEEAQVLTVTLDDATINTVDAAAPDDPSRLRSLASRRCSLSLSYGDSFNRRPVTRRVKFMDTAALFACIHVYSDRGIDTTPLYVELHSRMSLALSPLAFLLMGIPFGIRTRRSEASIGLAVSVILALFFYVFVVAADSLKYQGVLPHPELIVWIPNVVYQIGGLAGLRRLAAT